MSTVTAASAQCLTGAAVGIPPRPMQFDPPKLAPRHAFFNGNMLASNLFVVFSGIFPPGERFFMESVRRYRDAISDPVLQAKISGFIGQEALHRGEHERLNAFFSGRGIDVAMAEELASVGFGLLARLPSSQQLACTTFMEHFTALLAEQWLSDDHFQRSSDPEMLKLWNWHALEELEHKSVTHDVFGQVSSSHLERVAAGPFVVVALLPGILASFGWLVLRDAERGNWREHRRGLRELFGRRGFISSFLPKMPHFLRPDFHPDQRDTRGLEQQWRDKLFGEKGELLSKIGFR